MLQHPGNVAIRELDEIDEQEDLPFFPMEIMKGKSPTQAIHDDDWPASPAAPLLKDIAEALTTPTNAEFFTAISSRQPCCSTSKVARITPRCFDCIYCKVLLSLQIQSNDMVRFDASKSEPLNHADPKTFSTTHWSVVLMAGGESAEAFSALEHLCRTYWYPLYAHVRGLGHSAEDAQDLTQEFFGRMLERNYFKLANPQRGRFRTFLLSSIENYSVNEWKKGQAAKRGGRHQFFSLDDPTFENRYLAEPANAYTPAQIYDKRWAVALLERVVGLLRSECVEAGKEMLFDALIGYVVGDSLAERYDAIAQRLNMTENALRTTACRLRERYRELLRAEIADTVATSEEVDMELRHLIAVLRE